MNKFYEFRKTQEKKLEENSHLTLGDVTTVNVTQLKVIYSNFCKEILIIFFRVASNQMWYLQS